MTLIDLESATGALADLLPGVPDDLLAAPTPCPVYSVGDLLDHIGGLTLAFTGAARKTPGGGTQPPSGDRSRLAADWRTRIPEDLAALAAAWRDPAAWTGMTKAGGIDLPGEIAGLVALDELVVHSWDLARASGQPYEVDGETLEAVHRFVAQFADPAMEAQREGLFGPVVHVLDDAPLIDRVIGLTGRDPAWKPAVPTSR